MKKIIALLLSFAIAVAFTACKTLPQESSSATESTPSTFTSVYSELESSEETTSTDQTSKEPTSISSQEQTSTVAPPTPSSVPSSSTNSGGPSQSTNKVVHPISGLPLKDRANPETGLSWDGVSPIIYTYPDGTTGTEPKDGATYEYLPGWIETYKVLRDAIGREVGSICTHCGKTVGTYSSGTKCEQNARAFYCCCCGVFVEAFTCHTCAFITNEIPYCTHCGKISGDGLNGTCLRYWAGNGNECPNCGDFVSVKICHTCTHGCRYCGKPMGNGLNGTCYRDYFGSSTCPSCGVHVPINTCHACG